MLTIYIEDKNNNTKGVNKTLQSMKSCFPEDSNVKTQILSEDTFSNFGDTLRKDDSDYVYFIQAGDTFSGSAKSLLPLLSSRSQDIISLPCKCLLTSECKFPLSPIPGDLNTMPQLTPFWHYGHFFKREIFKTCTNLSDIELLFDIYTYLMDCHNVYLYPELSLKRQSSYENTLFWDDARNKDWYLGLVDHLLFPILHLSQSRNIALPFYLQTALCALIWQRFKCNMNNGNQHTIDSEYPAFLEDIKNFLNYIPDEALLYGQDHIPGTQRHLPYETILENQIILPMHFAVSMLQLKYQENFAINYDVVKKDSGETIIAKIGDVLLQDLSILQCTIELIQYDNIRQELTIEYNINDFVNLDNFTIKAYCNDTEIAMTNTYRYKHTKYFGISAQKPRTYRSIVPLSGNIGHSSQKKYDIYWTLSYRDVTLRMPIEAAHYCARINTQIYKSFWKFKKNLLTLQKDNTILRITPARGRMLWREFIFFIYNFRPHIATRIFGIRFLYWLTLPWFRNKTIWLTYDKLYKGGDCGEYLYRYACTRQAETGIIPAYVINGDSDDYARLKKEGYTPLRYKSLKHLLYYLNSSVVFTTHGGVYNFNGLTKASVRYVQGLLHHDVACIQHGLTVQQLAHNSNRLFNNMKRYYCASKYEINNLSQPIYGYEDKSILKLTGIPRYDGLVNNDQHQILITPTWRNYIALPATAKNEAKPYFPGFKDTDYFKIYNTLLSDERLIETAKRTGYKLIYLLHPVISAQLRDYPQNDYVKIIPSLTVNYEKILTESSLMVTDYSGVQFDFAYMRKPIIYYHPDELPPHYKEGGFFYDTMGFGEICKKHEDIVTLLCEYMENQCRMKDFYRKREDDFFAYDDLNSCQRIYDDMLSYQEEKGLL